MLAVRQVYEYVENSSVAWICFFFFFFFFYLYSAVWWAWNTNTHRKPGLLDNMVTSVYSPVVSTFSHLHIFSECKSSSRAKPGTSQESPYSQEIQSNPLSNLCEFKKRKEKRNPAEICKHRAVQDKCCQYLPPCVMKLQKWRSGLSHCGEFNSFKHQKTIF